MPIQNNTIFIIELEELLFSVSQLTEVCLAVNCFKVGTNGKIFGMPELNNIINRKYIISTLHSVKRMIVIKMAFSNLFNSRYIKVKVEHYFLFLFSPPNISWVVLGIKYIC